MFVKGAPTRLPVSSYCTPPTHHMLHKRDSPGPIGEGLLVDCLCSRVYTYRGRSVYKRRPISVPTRGSTQRMRKHIERVLLVGATVVLLAFGPGGKPSPVGIGSGPDHPGQPLPEKINPRPELLGLGCKKKPPGPPPLP